MFIKHVVLFLACCFAFTATSHIQAASDLHHTEKMGRPHAVGGLLPAPRRVELGDGNLILANSENKKLHYTLETHAAEKAFFAVKLFRERIWNFTKHSWGSGRWGKIETAWPLRLSVMQEVSGALSKAQGYRLIVNADGIECQASDGEGLVNAVATLNQLMKIVDGKLSVRYCTVEDYPEYRDRFINNYYWLPKEGLDSILSFLAAYKINGLTFGFHYVKWWGISESQRIELQRVKAYLDRYGYFRLKMHIHIGGRAGLRPLDVGDPKQINQFKDTIKELSEKYGMTHLMVLMDDVKNEFKSPLEKKQFKTPGQAQTYLMRQLKEFANKSGLQIKISYLTPYYNNLYAKKGVESDGREYVKQYFSDISEFPDDIAIVWTGPEVASRRISEKDIETYKDWFTRSPAMLYYDNNVGFNLPVPNFYGRFSPDFSRHFSDSMIHCNVTTNTLIRKYFAATFAGYAWNPKGFDSSRAWRTAALQLFTPREEIIPGIERFYQLHGDDYQVFFNKKVKLDNYAEALSSITRLVPELDFTNSLLEACQAQHSQK